MKLEKINEKLFLRIEEYIKKNYIEEFLFEESICELCEDEFKIKSPISSVKSHSKRRLEDVIGQIEETFSQALLRIIDEKGLTDVEAYKGANVDRRLFSKIRSQPDYNPSKITAISFAISLKLNLDETNDILARAGYALSPSNEFDLIIRYFIEDKNYDLTDINRSLFSFKQTLLGV